METVKITGDQAKDTATLTSYGAVDAVLDLSPPAAAKSTHLSSAIMALRHGGRVSLMGFGNLAASMWRIIGSDIMLKGKLMYSRQDMVQFVKMLEKGCFPTGQDLVNTKVFGLSEWKEALDVATEHTGIGKSVVFAPSQ